MVVYISVHHRLHYSTNLHQVVHPLSKINSSIRTLIPTSTVARIKAPRSSVLRPIATPQYSSPVLLPIHHISLVYISIAVGDQRVGVQGGVKGLTGPRQSGLQLILLLQPFVYRHDTVLRLHCTAVHFSSLLHGCSHCYACTHTPAVLESEYREDMSHHGESKQQCFAAGRERWRVYYSGRQVQVQVQEASKSLLHYCIYYLHGEVACKKSFVCFFGRASGLSCSLRTRPRKTKRKIHLVLFHYMTCIHLLYNTIQLWLR
jgi:hypothetical protein